MVAETPPENGAQGTRALETLTSSCPSTATRRGGRREDRRTVNPSGSHREAPERELFGVAYLRRSLSRS